METDSLIVDEDSLFESLFESIGIEKYDQHAVAAIIEYTRSTDLNKKTYDALPM